VAELQRSGRPASKGKSMIKTAELWHSDNSELWDQALEGYWKLVQPANKKLEREMDNLNLDDLVKTLYGCSFTPIKHPILPFATSVLVAPH
jgi:hypothetical protein